MSKLSLVFVLVGATAFTALGAWNMALQGEMQELRDQTERVEEVAKRPKAAGSGDSARVSGSTERTSTRFRELERRLAAMEGQAPAGQAAQSGDPVAGAAESGDGVVEQYAATADVSADFRSKVYAVLAEREVERRRQRQEREASRGVEMLLRGIEVTDQQRADVEAALLHMLLQRQELSVQDIDREVRQERTKELEAARDLTLEGILGAESFAQVKERRAKRSRRTGRRGGEGQRAGGARQGGGRRTRKQGQGQGQGGGGRDGQ
jgi:hypothetical protein